MPQESAVAMASVRNDEPDSAGQMVQFALDARGVARLTLNRPAAYNALSDAMLDALELALARVAGEPGARVVILAAAGPAFCAGHDLVEMHANNDLEFYRALFVHCNRVMMAIRRLSIPVIARVHGAATAAGCQLVAMCDLAVASSSARFATSGIRYGIFCSTPAVALSRNVSQKEAFEMLFTGDFIDAAAARERGLINRVAAPDALDDEIEALVVSILEKPAAAVATGKALFYRQLEMGIEAAYALSGQTIACNLTDAAAQEGLTAFTEKRKPRFAA